VKRARILPLLVSGMLLCLPLAAQARGHHHRQAAPQQVAVAELPPEAQETLGLIRRGGPFPFSRDGVVFGNREHRLPPQERGYYHEYTVRTPGIHGRGPRRIICGRVPDCYYTADHYRTFSRITGGQ
jgi:ribonuclease T1